MRDNSLLNLNIIRIISSILCSFVIVSFSVAEDIILFQGNVSSQEGLVFWNANGSGPEVVKIGHSVPFAMGSQPYYMATADHCQMGSSAGLSGNTIQSGFQNFKQLLDVLGFSLTELKIKWDLYTLGADKQGKDWWIKDGYEYRVYQSKGDLTIQLKGQDFVAAPAPIIYLIIDWNTQEFVLLSTPFSFQDISHNSTTPIRKLANIFLMEVEGKRFFLERSLNSLPTLTCLSGASDGRCGVSLSTVDVLLRERDDADQFTYENDNVETTVSVELLSVFPNPFNPITTIQFSLVEDTYVNIIIFDILGREISNVVSQYLTAGNHHYLWNAKDLATGFYFVKFQTAENTEIKRIQLLK